MAPPAHGRLNGDVLNFLRRAHRVLGEESDAADGPDAAAMRHEVVQTIVEQRAGAEETPAAAAHVFGSVALARVLRAADGVQRVALAAPLLNHPDPLSLVVDKCAAATAPPRPSHSRAAYPPARPSLHASPQKSTHLPIVSDTDDALLRYTRSRVFFIYYHHYFYIYYDD